MKKLIILLPTLITLTVVAQKPGNESRQLPPGITVMKPYWPLGENRELAIAGETTIYIGDSVVSSSKAKWTGSMEVIKADGKNLTVSLTEAVASDDVTLNDLMFKLRTGSDASIVEFRMDNRGHVIDIDNADEIKAKFIEEEERIQKDNGRRFNKEEKLFWIDSINTAFSEDNRLKGVLMNYARNFVGIYGKEIPNNADTLRKTIEIDPKRYFAEAKKPIKADAKLYQGEVKGAKFTLEEELNYRYDGLQDWILETKIKNPNLEEATWVNDRVSTTYDTKVHWPQKMSETLQVKNGKYRIVIKWSVKFNKPK